MPPIHGNPGRAVMLLKQLKQLSATLRNARFYGSPAVAESVTTSKVKKILSRDERRALVESYVNEYRAANGGKFPTLDRTIKEVGGSFYIVRNIFQELKFKQNAPLPIVAKALSEVPASVPNDGLNDPQSHSSAGVVDPLFQAETIKTEEERNLTYLGSRESKADHLEGAAVSENVVPTEEAKITKYSDEITLEGNNLLIVATQGELETKTFSTDHFEGPTVSAKVVPAEEAKITMHSVESNLQGDNLLIVATQEKRETEIVPNFPGSEKSLVLEVSSEILDAEEDENLTHLGSQESKVDYLEEAAVSENVVLTEETKITSQESKVDDTEEAAVSENVVLTEETKITSQKSKVDHTEEAAVSANVEETKITSRVSEKGAVEVETGERSSAWSNIVSFAKDFANFWRKK